MSLQTGLSYADALRYVSAWAAFDHDDIAALTRSSHEFHGHLGSLDFEYTASDHTLRAFAFVGAGMGLLLTSRAEVMSTLDRTARERPVETGNGAFIVRTLSWNMQVSPKLEPCLYLQMELADAALSVPETVKRLDDLSTAGYLWHGHKLLAVLAAY